MTTKSTKIYSIAEILTQPKSLFGKTIAISGSLVVYQYSQMSPFKWDIRGESEEALGRRAHEAYSATKHCYCVYLVSRATEDILLPMDVDSDVYKFRPPVLSGELSSLRIAMFSLKKLLIYRTFLRRFGWFTQSAILINQPSLVDRLESAGIGPMIIGTSFAYNLPATITGTLGKSNATGFRFEVNALNSILVHAHLRGIFGVSVPEISINF